MRNFIQFKFLYPILTIPGIISLFMPLTDGISTMNAILGLLDKFFHSPLNIVFENDNHTVGREILLISYPLFLPCLILLWSIRVLNKNQLTKAEIAIGYLLSILALVSILVATLYRLDRVENFLLYITLILILISIFLVFINQRKHVPHEINASASIHLAYIPNAVFCLVSFRDNLETGAYLALFTCILYGVETIILTRRGWKLTNEIILAGTS